MEDVFDTGVNSSKLHDNILHEYLIHCDFVLLRLGLGLGLWI